MEEGDAGDTGVMGRAWSLMTCLIAFCAAIGFLAGCSRFAPEREASAGPRAVAGVLDLRAWDFDREGSTRLGGEWKFYPGRLLRESDAGETLPFALRSVPHFWRGTEAGGTHGRGAGTYRLRVLLPPNHPPLAIRNLTVTTAFELEVDGELLARGGRPALTPQGARAGYNPGVTQIHPLSDAMNILVRVSNHEYRSGGMWRTFILGRADRLAGERTGRVYESLILFAAVWAISLNSLCIFLFRHRERTYLHFALFGLAIGLRPMVVGEYVLMGIFPAMPFDLLVRLEYATAFFSVPTSILFFLSLFGQTYHRRWVAALTLPFAPFVVFLLTTPLPFLTNSIFWFYAVALSAILVTAAFVLVRAAFRRRPGGLAMLIGGCIIALTAVNDILFSSFLIQTGSYLPYAIVLFVCLQAVVLARRFTAAFDAAEALSVRLATEVDHVTQARTRLETLLHEKELLLNEVHHRVKNSLQIVSSIISLQTHRVKDPAVQAITRTIRDRIRAISLAHERLYDVGRAELVDLGGYVRELVGLNVSGFGLEDGRLDIRVNTDSVRVDADLCIDLGLILTELIANAFEHALLERGGGTLAITLRATDEEITLEVADDGPGFPDGFRAAESRSPGLRIVSTLLEKHGGSIRTSAGPTANVVCTVPTAAARTSDG
jgi:two-component sensor histidine kinase